MGSKDNVEPEKIEQVFNKSFKDFDDFRVSELSDLLVIKQSKVLQLNREQTRLERKYGKDHSLTIQTAAKISYTRFQAAEINHEKLRAETPTPEADKDAWLIHGYLWDKDGNPSGEKCIDVFNENFARIDGANKAVTDAEGYFSLRETNLENYPAKVRVGISPGCVSEDVFDPHKGRVDYTEITTKADPCEPPPDTGKNWVIAGSVTNTRGAAQKDLLVFIYKDDDFEKEPLGKSKTDASGAYQFSFPDQQHGVVFKKNTELHFVARDANGNRIFNSQFKTQFGEDRVSKHDFKIGIKEDTKKNWVITGQVSDPRGKALEGLIVKLYGDDNFEKAPFGKADTNEKGEFRAEFPDEKFKEFFEKLRQFFIVLENKNGKKVFQTQEKTNFGDDLVSKHKVVVTNN